MFERLYRLTQFPRLTLFLGLVLALLGLISAQSRLRFSTDRTQLLGPNHPVQRDWAQYRQQFGRTSDYIILLRSPRLAATRKAADQLGASLSASPDFSQVLYRLDLPQLASQGLYYLTLSDLKRLRDSLRGAQPWLQLLARHPEMDQFLRQLAQRPQLSKDLAPMLPLLVPGLENLAECLESGGRSPLRNPLGPFSSDTPMLKGVALEPGQSRFYNQLADGKTLMVVALPRDLSGSFQADVSSLQALSKLVSQTQRAFPEVNLMVTGEPAINTEEMLEAQSDAFGCAGLALVTTALLLVVAFGQWRRPLCALASLVLGLSWSLGFASLVVRELNLLTVHFITILTGLGITFGIQMLSEYQRLRARGQLAPEAVRGGLEEAKQQAVGAITTAIAFFSLQFTSFRAAAELGWITGVGVLLCYLANLTMLPSLLSLGEGQSPCKGHPAYGRWVAPWELALRRRAKTVLLVGVLATLACSTWLGRVPFDYNLLHLQSEEAQAITVENYLQQIGYSTLYALSLAPNAAEARDRAERLARLASVSRVESLLSLEPLRMAQKQPLVEELVAMARQLPQLPQPRPLGAAQLLKTYQAFLELRQPLDSALDDLADHPQGARLQRVRRRLEQLLNPGNPGPLAAGLMHFQGGLQGQLAQQLAMLKQQKAQPPDIQKAVPEELRRRSLSPQGNFCLRIFPRGNCWERLPLERFVADLRTIDPHITGTPILIHTYLEELQSAYTLSGRNALLVISLLLLAYYRSWRRAGLALLPKLVGVVWMVAALGMVGGNFNAANFLALPLTLGTGLVFGIESLRICRQPGCPLLSQQSVGFAVALSGLTTLVGFSTLMQAQHRGVASFGLVMSLGVSMNLLSSLVVLPCLLQVLSKKTPD